MSDLLRRPLVRRAAREQRAWLVVIGALLLLNVVVYLAVIRPLSGRVSNVTERTQKAETELAQAKLAQSRAAAALTGKSEAARELDVFYRQVLPTSMPAARHLFWPRLATMARQSGLQWSSDNAELVGERGSQLTQVTVESELTGRYAAVRTFLHRLERATEFIIIDRVSLEESAAEDILSLKVQMSTLYRGTAQ